jgi:hypothetical protein
MGWTCTPNEIGLPRSNFIANGSIEALDKLAFGSRKPLQVSDQMKSRG